MSKVFIINICYLEIRKKVTLWKENPQCTRTDQYKQPQIIKVRIFLGETSDTVLFIMEKNEALKGEIKLINYSEEQPCRGEMKLIPDSFREEKLESTDRKRERKF